MNQPTITLSNGKIKPVKNLGWLMRHKSEIAVLTAYYNGSIVARTYTGIVYRCAFADLSVRECWLAKRFPQTIYTFEYSEVFLPDPVFTFDDIDYWPQYDGCTFGGPYEIMIGYTSHAPHIRANLPTLAAAQTFVIRAMDINPRGIGYRELLIDNVCVVPRLHGNLRGEIFAPIPPARPLTVEDAKRLPIGSMLYHTTKRNADGTAMRAKVTSVKTWKRSPDRVEIHLKHGMYDFAVFTESDVHLLTRTEPEPIKISRKR